MNNDETLPPNTPREPNTPRTWLKKLWAFILSHPDWAIVFIFGFLLGGALM